MLRLMGDGSLSRLLLVFATIDWSALLGREIEAPLIPIVPDVHSYDPEVIVALPYKKCTSCPRKSLAVCSFCDSS